MLNTIKRDLKNAVKSKNKNELNVLRMLLSALKNKEIAFKKELSNQDILDVIRSEVKKRKDSIKDYKKGNRFDLVEQEEKEILILDKYLPKQLSKEEIKKVILKEIKNQDLTIQNFGKLMGIIMPKLKNKADGNLVSQSLKELIQS